MQQALLISTGLWARSCFHSCKRRKKKYLDNQEQRVALIWLCISILTYLLSTNGLVRNSKDESVVRAQVESRKSPVPSALSEPVINKC